MLALVLALLLRTFVIEAFKIPSGSMMPSLLVGDYILVNKFIYYFTEPQRGDMIVFKFPQDPRRDFIKRIIGMPGDTLEIKDKQVFIGGKPLTEGYAFKATQIIYARESSNRDNFGPLTIPPGSYFVLGDNRDNSLDSRFWGVLKETSILGNAVIIYWSWNRNGRGMSLVRWDRFGKVIR